jgi:phosphatidylserine synthase
MRSWGLLWVLAAISIGLVFMNLDSFNYRWLTLVVCGGVLLYFLILLVTPWNFPSLRDKGIPERLLVHLVGPIMLLVGHALSSVERKLSR